MTASSSPSDVRLDDPEKSLRIWNVTKPWVDVQMVLGEGPYYEPSSDSVRWVDIYGKKIYWINIKKGPESLRFVEVEDPVGVTTDIHGDDDNILVAAKYGYAIMDKQTGNMTYINKPFDSEGADKSKRMRFNDGAVDAKGRFWAGSMTDNALYPVSKEGIVFRLDPTTSTDSPIDHSKSTLSSHISPVQIPNGIGWSLNKPNAMYFTDSLTRTIWEYKYDASSGGVSNPRPWFVLRGSILLPATDDKAGQLFTFDKSMVPDGFQFDNTGALWTAVWGAGMVLRIEESDGRPIVTGVVRVPTRCSSCLRFVPGGGMVITSASEEESSTFGDGGPFQGRIFWVDVGIEGAETYKFGRLNGSEESGKDSEVDSKL